MNTQAKMKQTMEDMISAEGYYVKVAIRNEGYYVTTDAISNADGLSLFYIHSHTPAEVAQMVVSFFDKLNGKKPESTLKEVEKAVSDVVEHFREGLDPEDMAGKKHIANSNRAFGADCALDAVRRVIGQ